jgi:hypothetical protein
MIVTGRPLSALWWFVVFPLWSFDCGAAFKVKSTGANGQHHAIIYPSTRATLVINTCCPRFFLSCSLVSIASLTPFDQTCHSFATSYPLPCTTSIDRLHLTYSSILPKESLPSQDSISPLQADMKVIASLVALTAATAVAAPAHKVTPRDLVDDAAPHQDDPNFVSAVMRAHWYWRRLHCAQDLVWDPELAKQARADVEKCPDKPTHVCRILVVLEE